MNTIWSDYVQGVQTLYLSRKLRFNDCFSSQYEALFAIPREKEISFLEIGCGPGAFAAALHRWYPRASITGLDRDSQFIRFAKDHVPDVGFLEGDATALPFQDGTFDVTLSNTVSEHIEHSKFFDEQYRVLKHGGICLVLSVRKSIHVPATCLENDAYERSFWEKVQKHDTSLQDFQVCQYPLSEAELPAMMERYGFSHVSSGYVLLPLTPDDPNTPKEMALEIIEAGRANALEGIETAFRTMPQHVSREEADQMRIRTNQKYDQRIALYLSGKKQWNTHVTIVQVVRGEKA